MLNRRLAAAIHPYGQLKQAPRNVGGPSFIAVPELFDRVTREAESDSDLMAERTAGMGAVAEGQSRSRPRELSLSRAPCGSPTKANAAALAAFEQSAPKLSDNRRRAEGERGDVSRNITRALHRSWIHDPNTIEVSAQGGKIRLTGHVTTRMRAT